MPRKKFRRLIGTCRGGACPRRLRSPNRPPQNVPRNIRAAHHKHNVLAEICSRVQKRRRTCRSSWLRQNMLLHKQNLYRPQHRVLTNKHHVIHELPNLTHILRVRRARCQSIRNRVASLRPYHAISLPRPKIRRRPLRLHTYNLHVRRNLFYCRRHAANQCCIPHGHHNRASLRKLLQNLAPNRPRSRRQIRVRSIVQKINSSPLRVLVGQFERRRQIRSAALHNLRSEGSNLPPLHWIASSRQKNARFHAEKFRRPSHRRPMIPRTARNYFLDGPLLQSSSQPPQSPSHLERPRRQLRLQFQPSPLPHPPTQKRRRNQPCRPKILRKKFLRLSYRCQFRFDLQWILREQREYLRSAQITRSRSYWAGTV